MDDLPPEILATAFEIGVLTWGIHFLPAVCLVCRDWNSVVQNAPHLWGIIQVTKSSQVKRLLDRIIKAKDAPLTVYISPRASDMLSITPVLAALIRKCNRWARATLSTPGLPGELFFKPSENEIPPSGSPVLRILSMTGWHEDGSWTKHLLSPSLQHLCLTPGFDHKIPVISMLDQLYRTPNARRIEFRQVVYQNEPADLLASAVIHLDKLVSLELSSINYPSLLLSYIARLSLQKLIVGPRLLYEPPGHDKPLKRLAPFLSRWCQPGFVPSSLHTLELFRCMQPSDIPYLIRFLAQLPNLVVLDLDDDALDDSPEQITDEDNVLRALSSPEGARSGIRGWLRPSLMAFHFENVNIRFQDLLDVARVRGCNSSSTGEGTTEEAQELYELLEEASLM
ncbi:hypothetical protein EST38_g5018 [Candolleomyces aberdarensis]|uniref:Uncharacterized protein n=1 Tax=Candolleomyces aberdarensis TaxID=2316362 RepID=A0A4Q2DPR3_9AGAR|nr:hypothetical protein EST38_g5018 [Candolleomyces aberdarensis]